MTELLKNFASAWRALSTLTPVFLSAIALSLVLSILYNYINKNIVARALVVFLVFSVFGSTIGVFMGASKSPIVTSLLPPIITLIAGYIAYLGSKELPKEFKELLPGAVLLLLSNLLFSAFYMKFWLLPE
jgi:uncharacterized membrane protein YfcA